MLTGTSPFYGNDLEGIKQHWISIGIREGRRATPIFDVNFYMSVFSTARAIFENEGYEGVYRHWLTEGIRNGLIGSSVFDVKYYLSANHDLYAAYGANFELAARHWLNDDSGQCRVASRHFNILTYLANNPDVYNFTSGNCPASIIHWITYGSNESRTATNGLDFANTSIDCNNVGTVNVEADGGTTEPTTPALPVGPDSFTINASYLYVGNIYTTFSGELIIITGVPQGFSYFVYDTIDYEFNRSFPQLPEPTRGTRGAYYAIVDGVLFYADLL